MTSSSARLGPQFALRNSIRCGSYGKTYGSAGGMAVIGIFIDQPEYKPAEHQESGEIEAIKCLEDQTCTDDPANNYDPAIDDIVCANIGVR